MDGELETASLALAEENNAALTAAAISTNFTCGMHFYEEVEDTKDSVWVVQVVRDRQRLFVPHKDWKAFVKKVSRFGVRTGIFDCSFDQSLCDKKSWYRPQLVLAMPQGYQAKDHVVLKSYSGSSQPQAVFDWVNVNLASRISDVTAYEDLAQDWYHFRVSRRKVEKVRVVLFSTMKIPPMFYSVLSVKFTGRVKFGNVLLNDATNSSREIVERLNITKLPVYQVVTPEETKTFAAPGSSGEYLSYQSMGLLLRTLHPEVNDIFLLSLIIVNTACSLEFFVSRGGVLKRFGRALWSTVKWNFLLILLWLPVLGLFQLPYVDAVFEYALAALRYIGTTRFACCVRADWLYYSSVGGWTFLIVTFLLFAFAVAWLHHVYRLPDAAADAQGPNANTPGNVGLAGLLNIDWEAYLSSVVQQATGPHVVWPPLGIQRGPGRYTATDIGMELLIERLAVPNLWLQPTISSQYIHSLPVWKYTGPCRPDSDIGSDGECVASQAAEEEVNDDAAADDQATASLPTWPGIGHRPLMFVCERCRALQSAARAPARSQQELEQERLESESACAKYLMDGNYKCMCGGGTSEGAGDGGEGSGGGPGHQQCARNRSPQKDHVRPRDPSPAAEDDTGIGMPNGIIPTYDCSICLEGYKRLAILCGLPCGHAFHQQCIMGWLTRDNHVCPICRWPSYKAKPCSMHKHFD